MHSPSSATWQTIKEGDEDGKGNEKEEDDMSEGRAGEEANSRSSTPLLDRCEDTAERAALRSERRRLKQLGLWDDF